MSLTKGQRQLMKFEYDFDVDGGAISEIALRQVAGLSLASGVHVTDVFVIAETELASAGTPTITFGNSNDPDGYMADSWAILSSGGALALRAGEVAGDLIYDDTIDMQDLAEFCRQWLTPGR